MFQKEVAWLPRSKPLKTLSRRIRAEREAAGAFGRVGYPPILIYQMGKVGSSAVYKTLRKAGLKNPVLFLHFLSQDLPEVKKLFDRAGVLPAPYHVFLGEALRRRILGFPDPICKIISLVRDPIDRTVSDLYQNPAFAGAVDLYGSGTGIIDAGRAVRFLKTALSEEKTFKYINEWFDRELKRVFGIDVFNRPFPVDAGVAVYRAGNAEALVIRLENLSGAGEAAIANFLNLEHPFRIQPGNIRRETPAGESYLRVKQALRLPRDLCERIYAGRFARHFYSSAMIEQFIRKWSEDMA
jgi:hypothetical protein